MTVSGADCSDQADYKLVARKNNQTLLSCVPPEVAGINFLSGGLSEEAHQFIKEMNLIGGTPWNVSFSYGRRYNILVKRLVRFK